MNSFVDVIFQVKDHQKKLKDLKMETLSQFLQQRFYVNDIKSGEIQEKQNKIKKFNYSKIIPISGQYIHSVSVSIRQTLKEFENNLIENQDEKDEEKAIIQRIQIKEKLEQVQSLKTMIYTYQLQKDKEHIMKQINQEINQNLLEYTWENLLDFNIMNGQITELVESWWRDSPYTKILVMDGVFFEKKLKQKIDGEMQLHIRSEIVSALNFVLSKINSCLLRIFDEQLKVIKIAEQSDQQESQIQVYQQFNKSQLIIMKEVKDKLFKVLDLEIREKLNVEDDLQKFEILLNGCISRQLKISALSFIESNVHERVVTSMCSQVDSLFQTLDRDFWLKLKNLFLQLFLDWESKIQKHMKGKFSIQEMLTVKYYFLFFIKECYSISSKNFEDMVRTGQLICQKEISKHCKQQCELLVGNMIGLNKFEKVREDTASSSGSKGNQRSSSFNLEEDITEIIDFIKEVRLGSFIDDIETEVITSEEFELQTYLLNQLKDTSTKKRQKKFVIFLHQSLPKLFSFYSQAKHIMHQSEFQKLFPFALLLLYSIAPIELSRDINLLIYSLLFFNIYQANFIKK